MSLLCFEVVLGIVTNGAEDFFSVEVRAIFAGKSCVIFQIIRGMNMVLFNGRMKAGLRLALSFRIHNSWLYGTLRHRHPDIDIGKIRLILYFRWSVYEQ